MTVQAHDSMLVTGPTVVEPPIYVPVTTNTVALAPTSPIAAAIVAPVGTLAALTLTIANGFIAGQQQRVLFTQITTTLTCSGSNLSASILALPTATTAGQQFTFVWSLANAYWVRIA